MPSRDCPQLRSSCAVAYENAMLKIKRPYVLEGTMGRTQYTWRLVCSITCSAILRVSGPRTEQKIWPRIKRLLIDYALCCFFALHLRRFFIYCYIAFLNFVRTFLSHSYIQKTMLLLRDNCNNNCI